MTSLLGTNRIGRMVRGGPKARQRIACGTTLSSTEQVRPHKGIALASRVWLWLLLCAIRTEVSILLCKSPCSALSCLVNHTGHHHWCSLHCSLSEGAAASNELRRLEKWKSSNWPSGAKQFDTNVSARCSRDTSCHLTTRKLISWTPSPWRVAIALFPHGGRNGRCLKGSRPRRQDVRLYRFPLAFPTMIHVVGSPLDKLGRQRRPVLGLGGPGHEALVVLSTSRIGWHEDFKLFASKDSLGRCPRQHGKIHRSLRAYQLGRGLLLVKRSVCVDKAKLFPHGNLPCRWLHLDRPLQGKWDHWSKCKVSSGYSVYQWRGPLLVERWALSATERPGSWFLRCLNCQ